MNLKRQPKLEVTICDLKIRGFIGEYGEKGT
jgi:hypothetical protein